MEIPNRLIGRLRAPPVVAVTAGGQVRVAVILEQHEAELLADYIDWLELTEPSDDGGDGAGDRR